MAEIFKVNEHSQCQSCSDTPAQNDCVQCFVCKSVFHFNCENCDNDHKLGTQTLLKCFLAPSTKNNFKFFCDICQTNFERSLVETQDEKIANLERNFLGMEAKLTSILNLLQNEKEDSTDQAEKPSQEKNIWADTARLANVKAPSPTSMLVVRKDENEEKRQENQKIVEEAIMANDVSVVESYQNKSGDIMVVCESEEMRNQLKDIVTANNEMIVSTPREVRHSVTIVGLPNQYEKEEVVDMMIK